MTQRWKILVEYDGTDFVGWQIQNEGVSVQGVLEDAVFKFAEERVRVHAAGRTDSGVHALGMVAHFDLEKPFTAAVIRDALNACVVPHEVSVVSAEEVSPEFHARFTANKRYYRYTIFNRRAPHAVGRRYAWHVKKFLDIGNMQKAANLLLGKHDFTSFRALVCQAKSPIRSIDKINITREGDFVHIDVEAPSFLHHQVRNIVGTLKKIGEGSWEWDIMPSILEAKDRAAGGPTAPPQGLYFVKVDYNDSGNK